MDFMTSVNLTDRLHRAEANYEKTLALLAALKSGEVSLQEVRLIQDGWQIAPKPPVEELSPAAAIDLAS